MRGGEDQLMPISRPMGFSGFFFKKFWLVHFFCFKSETENEFVVLAKPLWCQRWPRFVVLCMWGLLGEIECVLRVFGDWNYLSLVLAFFLCCLHFVYACLSTNSGLVLVSFVSAMGFGVSFCRFAACLLSFFCREFIFSLHQPLGVVLCFPARDFCIFSLLICTIQGADVCPFAGPPYEQQL